MKLSLVIPAYNESAIIEDTVRMARDKLRGAFDDFELVIVDDGSRDGTADAAASLGFDDVCVTGYSENCGKGCAVKTGILAATGDIVFFTDADLAYGLDIVIQGARLLLDSGSDVVAGSRRLDKSGYGGYPIIRVITSKGFSLIARLASGMHYDTQCGIKGFTARAAAELFGKCETSGFAFDFEIMMLADALGLKVLQMPARVLNHRDSRVGILRDSFRMLREIVRIRRRVKRQVTKYS